MRQVKRFICLAVFVAGVVLTSAMTPATSWASDEVDQLTKELQLAKLKQEIAEVEQKLAVAKATAGYAELKALKDNLGNTALKGQGGVVAAGDKNLPFLLWSSMGGIPLLDNAAKELCTKLSGKNYVLVTSDFASQMRAAEKFKDNLSLLSPGTVTTKAVAEIAMVAAGIMFALNTVSDISKAFRTDRTVIAGKNDNAGALFIMALQSPKNCQKVVAKDTIEAEIAIESLNIYKEFKSQIESIRGNYLEWETEKSLATDLVKSTLSACEKSGFSGAPWNSYIDAVEKRRKISQREAKNMAVKAALDQMTEATLTAMAEILAIGNTLKAKGYNRLSVTLNTQDLQINADNFWSKSLRRMPMLEVLYTASTNSTTPDTGYIGLKGVESKIDWDKEDTVIHPSPAR